MRVKGWEQRLYALTVEAIGKPHQWGQHDCVTFAADVVRAITGHDPMGDLRGTYDSPSSAARVMVKAGAYSIGDLAGLHLPEITASEARRGDIVLSGGAHDFLAVCVGRTAVAPSERGMVHVPMAQAVRAFRVGD